MKRKFETTVVSYDVVVTNPQGSVLRSETWNSSKRVTNRIKELKTLYKGNSVTKIKNIKNITVY